MIRQEKPSALPSPAEWRARRRRRQQQAEATPAADPFAGLRLPDAETLEALSIAAEVTAAVAFWNLTHPDEPPITVEDLEK